MSSSLGDAVKLPCGLVFPNRLVKASHFDDKGQGKRLTSPGGNGRADGRIRTYAYTPTNGSNVQVDVNHLGSPFDPALPAEYTGKESNPALVQTWAKYADACQQHGVPSIVQICHPGRQSFRIAGKRGLFAPTIAPSAIPLQMGEGLLDRIISRLAFPAPREMTQQDIDTVTRQFVDTARLMADAGFSGIELHGAHGYLIDQFLNPKTNLRTDAYGGSAEKRAKFVLDILSQTRKVVPATFCIGIKFNSADHSSASFEDTMTQIALLVDAGIDFLEVSGGSYEDPRMMGAKSHPEKSQRTLAREAFFLEFARETRKRFPTLVLMLTGGFRTRTGAEYALQENACDLVGIGRPAAVDTAFARLLLDESVPAEEAKLPLNKVKPPFLLSLLPIKAVGAGLESSYYAGQIKRIGNGLKTFAPSLGSTIAKILAENTREHPDVFEERVQMWVFEEDVTVPEDSPHREALGDKPHRLTEVINRVHENVKYLPGIALPDTVVANPDLRDAVQDATLLVFNLPHQFIDKTLEQMKGHHLPYARAVSCVKGVEVANGRVTLFSELIMEKLGIYCGSLSGANIAPEVAAEEFCETTIGYDPPPMDLDAKQEFSPDNRHVINKQRQRKISSTSAELQRVPDEYPVVDEKLLHRLFERPYFHVHVVADVAGVALCGALKNIVALAAGFVAGKKWGENSKAAIIRIGMMEMIRFGRIWFPESVNEKTFTEESAGVADLVDEIEQSELNGQKLQGTSTARAVCDFLSTHGKLDDFPLFDAVNRILDGKVSVDELPKLLK
ncbi:uncharacterized protein CDV56_109038 [Aspergillus thermomutatus]|uniref:Glycerol-3-phosphate dehydrogenase [NAD(+)] n=1 Tax=Aspergillus thermomutatus TaxID=41047 RepID=A0A397I397_ASPTH|nr:uncharacterized protein CDV56_109038 [Aspergillus thermomutatus]RHZ67733.1 hypothetical protein CDV56_109038 [Aspergillus thermomutatus]